MMSSGVGIPSFTVISFSANRKSLLYAVATHTCIKLCHFWHSLHACVSSDWYFSLLFEGFPHCWHSGNTPVMSSGVGIPSPTIISFGTNSNTLCLFDLVLILKLFSTFSIHALVSYWWDKYISYFSPSAGIP